MNTKTKRLRFQYLFKHSKTRPSLSIRTRQTLRRNIVLQQNRQYDDAYKLLKAVSEQSITNSFIREPLFDSRKNETAMRFNCILEYPNSSRLNALTGINIAERPKNFVEGNSLNCENRLLNRLTSQRNEFKNDRKILSDPSNATYIKKNYAIEDNIGKYRSKLSRIYMFVYFSIVLGKVFEQCELPDYQGIVIHKYYNDRCPHCQRIAPLIEEIDNRLEENGIKSRVRSVECSRCRCSGIDAVPTVIVTKDNKELGRIRGYRDYPELSEFFAKTLKIEQGILKRSPADEPSEVAKLFETDFNKPFIGPWLILFYKNRNDKHRELFIELNKFFQGRMRFGEAREKDMGLIARRYGIEVYPTMVGMYNGVTVLYKGESDLGSMIEWCENFIAPVLIDIDKVAFDILTEETFPGEPLYLVFYTSLSLANKTFSSLAHQLRARTRFYKTNDPQMFKIANLHPQNNDNANEALILAVYRNRMFHKFNGDVSDNATMMEWIYHTHYPLLTRITTFSFSGIFFGFKPVLLLISNNDYLFQDFEKYSEKAHANLPFTQFIHAAINHNEFATVLNKSLKHLKTPAIVIYDPIRKVFFGENIIITKENLSYISTKLCTQYMDNKIKRFGHKSYKKQYFAVFVFIIGILAFGFRRNGGKTVKIQ